MKVTKEMVDIILDPKFNGLSNATLGKLLKVSGSTVCQVRKYKSFDSYHNWASSRRSIKKTGGIEIAVIPTRPVADCPFEIGGEYFIRTVTYHLTGRLVQIVGKFLMLEDCAWIADSGRFHQFFTNPSTGLEVEPFGDRTVGVNMDSIVDFTERKVLLEVK